MPSQESSQDEGEIIKKGGIEEWRWSEMQGLELVSENHQNHQNLDTLIEEDKERLDMEAEGQNGNNKDNEKKDKIKKKESHPTVGFGELFRFADGLDYVLMGIGTLGAFVHGCSLPIFLRFFADLVNSFGSNANNIDKMTQEVLKVQTFFFFLTKISFFCSNS